MPYGTVNADLMTTSDGVSSSGLYGFKNRLINSAMVIDQRNAGASVTSGYPVDRWSTNFSVGSKFTLQRSTTAPAGFSNSVLITSTSAYSLGASDYFLFNQLIEGLNFADFGWGTANAVPATMSFWVRASITGTYSVQIQSGSATYVFYLTTYTVNSANTWEYKTITIPAPTSGGFPTDNSAVFSLRFTLGSGSSQTTAPTTSWQTSGVGLGATGQVNVAGTNGATWYVTGVQLEKGSTATSFDYRPYGTELSLCQRYYEVVNATLGAYVDNGAVDNVRFYIAFKVTKRANPTVTSGSGGSESGGTWTPAYSGVDVNGTNCASSIGSTITRPYINAPIIASIEL